jgi:GTP-binding protein
MAVRHDARFVLSAAAADQLPSDALPHVALVGRSNVGKSTLINALAKQSLARTSQKPGKTRLLNVYRLEHAALRLFLIDLPGYGYAGRRDGGTEFDAMVGGYFEARRASAVRTLALLAVDGRHPGLNVDMASWDWLGGAGVERAVVVTKLDKLTSAERAANLREFSKLFDAPVAAVSAERGEGIDTLWTLIRTRLQPS